MDIHDKMKHDEDKQIIRAAVKDLREQLMNENK